MTVKTLATQLSKCPQFVTQQQRQIQVLHMACLFANYQFSHFLPIATRSHATLTDRIESKGSAPRAELINSRVCQVGPLMGMGAQPVPDLANP